MDLFSGIASRVWHIQEESQKQEYTIFPFGTLLERMNKQRVSPSTTFSMYGRVYISLHWFEVDELCDWVYETRDIV